MIRKAPPAALVLAMMASVAACTGAPSGGYGPVPLTPTQRFALQVEPGLDRIALAVHDEGLSGAQTAALSGLAERFGIEGAPVLRIEAPSGGDPVAGAFAYRIKGALEAVGAPGHRIQIVAYDAPDPRAPVLVGFDTVRAAVPRCGGSWTSLTRTANNDSSANFGCAVNANLAAQIADPRDIVRPRDMAPADGARRSVVLDFYRKGQATAAPREDLVAGGRISQAVN